MGIFCCGRLQRRWAASSEQKVQGVPQRVRLRAFYSCVLAHRLFARPRYELPIEIGLSYFRYNSLNGKNRNRKPEPETRKHITCALNQISLSQIFAGRSWLIMGILNVTPDSFHDGGRFRSFDAAVEWAGAMARAGAAIIDVGGESTRPWSEPVGVDEELERVIPVIEALAGSFNLPVSVDTSKAEVARRALDAGAAMINDVTAFRGDPAMAAVAAEAGCPVCLMHMLGKPRTMQDNPSYREVIGDIADFFRRRIDFALSHGVRRENIILDPGIGFGKTVEHNLAVISRLDEFASLGRPLMVGASRKRFIGTIAAEEDTGRRLPGTISANVLALRNGASVFRVHDVAENFQALKVAAAILKSGRGGRR